MMHKVLTRNFDVPQMQKLAVAKQHGAYGTLEKLFRMKPAEVTEEVKVSGLRGRGGAGFPTGVKWGFIPKNSGKPVYLVVNADESEPGTFKDRAILERDPHLLIEGIMISAYAIGAKLVFIYFRGEYIRQMQVFNQAVDEVRAEGLLGKNILGSEVEIEIISHRGAGAYICGEETSMLSSLEGFRGWPRIKPPFPAVEGLFGCPTIVNNVETIAALPYIIREGAAEYKKMGTEGSPGTKLVSVCGHVEKPGVYEIELGLPISTFLEEYAGGIRGGMELKAVIPGGSSVPVMTAAEAMSTNYDYESLAEKGTMLGSGGMIVIAGITCMVKVLAELAKFYAHESCGQCTPCREGTGWAKKILDRMEAGGGMESDLTLLKDIADGMIGRTICVLADALAMPIQSFLAKFGKEFEDHIHFKRCPSAGKEGMLRGHAKQVQHMHVR